MIRVVRVRKAPGGRIGRRTGRVRRTSDGKKTGADANGGPG